MVNYEESTSENEIDWCGRRLEVLCRVGRNSRYKQSHLLSKISLKLKSKMTLDRNNKQQMLL